MNVYVGNRLPSEYQEVEYIQSSGTQYIDTGFKPSNTTKVICKACSLVLGVPIYGVGVFGSYQSICLLSDSTNYRARFRNGSSSNATVTSSVPVTSTPHIFNLSQSDGFYIDGVLIGTFPSYSFTETRAIYLFGWNSSGSFTAGASHRIYYLEIYSSGTLVRDFVPCYRISDSVIGLYDLVNNQFYTNAGTGTFSKGNDVTMAELKNAYIGEYVVPYLCFTANTASSTVKLNKTGSPTAVTLETSTDGNTWTSYTIGNTITLSNIGDKVYRRNTSTTDTGFSTGTSNYYKFVMTGSIAGSGDINYLLNKNSTTTVSSNCYCNMFNGCTSLTTAPELPATTLATYCYSYMFNGCTNLTTVPSLPATTLATECYAFMFTRCSKIKLSKTQTGEYQTAYRIPTTGTGTTATDALIGMFQGTGGTLTGTPNINTTYYTSNTVV